MLRGLESGALCGSKSVVLRGLESVAMAGVGTCRRGVDSVGV